MARPTKAAGYGPVRLYKDKRTGYWWARFQYRSQREKLKVVGAGGVPVTRKDVAERHAREIAELLESGQYSKLRNRTAARSKSFADLVEEFIEKAKALYPIRTHDSDTILFSQAKLPRRAQVLFLKGE